jgi:DNA-directed RNA polymerase specialized sigma24 family protein
MSSTGSITHWISQLKAGDQAAAQKLWEGYFQRLVALARKKLRGIPRRAADEEDVALSAFDDFCRCAEQGRFPQLSDRDDLWQVLVVLTDRKAIRLVHHERRQKRGGGAAQGECTVLRPHRSSAVQAELQQIRGQEPTPEFAAEVAEECQRLLARLGDEELRSVALWKMEGYTNAEIAAKLGCVPRTVERKLRVIRSRWHQEMAK